ncbi:MAG: hypothetical protein ACI8Z1_000047 [Candidatus Azotimanducaceae bacterium]|jgi:hypothetical protein
MRAWTRGTLVRIVILLVCFLASCTSSTITKPVFVETVPQSTALITAFDAPGAQLDTVESTPAVGFKTAVGFETALNIAITEFKAKTSQTSTLLGAVGQVRRVESRYLPSQLKDTLDRTGFWGAVRVMPVVDPGAELNVTGEVIQSDGIVLHLRVTARDTSGRVWIDDVYEDRAGELDYAVDPDYRHDPFEDIYHQIANDLYQVRLSLADEEVRRIVDLTNMRYARALAPDVFGKYLEEVDGRLALLGLPAADDPLFARVQRIRESEYLFTDSVDAHYESLKQRLGPTYAWWRYYSYELTMGNRRLEGIDATRGATRGSWYAMERIYKTYKESKMNEDALRELSESFDRETAPTVAELSGRVVRLSGTLEKQYEQWRRILKEMYDAELGL